MSWLFGTSKKRTQVPVYVDNEVEEGFSVVSTRQTLPESRVQPESLPYPPYLAICPQAPPGYVPRTLHPLDNVPFKLLDSLDPISGKSKVIEMEKLGEKLRYLQNRLKSEEFSYSFQLERSVLREECAGYQ